MRFEHGIVILPENIRLLSVMTAEEIGESVKALCLYVSGIEPEEAAFASEKALFTYLVLKRQIDTVEEKARKTKWRSEHNGKV